MRVLSVSITPTEKIIDEAIAVLKNGGLVVFPTETAYGIGAMATSEAGVKKLLSYKKRPSGKAISIAVSDKSMAQTYVEINADADNIYSKFLPGPVTVISGSKRKVVKELESENGTLGVRWPDYQLTLDIISQLGAPITATSANQSGRKTPYIIDDILENISQKQKEMIDLIIDAGELPHNPPSTVIDVSANEMKVLRTGSINPSKLIYGKKIKTDIEMTKAGIELMRKLFEPKDTTVLLLEGELGSGKTHFVKGVAEFLGIEEIIKSPTYSIMEEYNYKLRKLQGNLVHIDAWRLENLNELKGLQLEKFFKPGNVIAVEWSGGTLEFFRQFKQHLRLIFIELDYSGRETREIRVYEG